MKNEIEQVRREALAFAHGSGASVRYSDRQNLETIGSAMRFRPSAPLWQRQRWELAYLAMGDIEAAERSIDFKDGQMDDFLRHARLILDSHCGICARGERCSA